MFLEALRFSAQPMDVTVDPVLQRAGAFQQLVREAQLGSRGPSIESKLGHFSGWWFQIFGIFIPKIGGRLLFKF